MLIKIKYDIILINYLKLPYDGDDNVSTRFYTK